VGRKERKSVKEALEKEVRALNEERNHLWSERNACNKREYVELKSPILAGYEKKLVVRDCEKNNPEVELLKRLIDLYGVSIFSKDKSFKKPKYYDSLFSWTKEKSNPYFRFIEGSSQEKIPSELRKFFCANGVRVLRNGITLKKLEVSPWVIKKYFSTKVCKRYWYRLAIPKSEIESRIDFIENRFRKIGYRKVDRILGQRKGSWDKEEGKVKIRRLRYDKSYLNEIGAGSDNG